ncbi:MAG TPA: hypothetical protein VGZ00_04375 [Candidatus Baltobacteraceae bacterium]|nr:hypothetical protein [Candidatus Baltobacteraceae bacterium]
MGGELEDGVGVGLGVPPPPLRPHQFPHIRQVVRSTIPPAPLESAGGTEGSTPPPPPHALISDINIKAAAEVFHERREVIIGSPEDIFAPMAFQRLQRETTGNLYGANSFSRTLHELDKLNFWTLFKSTQ